MTKCFCALAFALSLTACAGERSAMPEGPAFAVLPGAQAVRYVDTHGIEVAVPASWPLNRGLCGTPKADTVLWNEDGTLLCGTSQPQGLSVVEFSGSLRRLHGYRRDTTPVTIDGIYARRWDAGTVMGSHEVRLDFASRNLSVTVLSPEPSLLGRILASVRAISVDQAGCPTHPTGVYTHGSRTSGSKAFVPGGARRMVGCSYQGRWLDHSNLVGPTAARHLARALDAAPYGFSSAPHDILPSACGSTWRGSSIVARFEYVAGRPVVVTAHLDGCARLGASNGRWGVRPRPWWVGLLTNDARYAGALIDPHTLR